MSPLLLQDEKKDRQSQVGTYIHRHTSTCTYIPTCTYLQGSQWTDRQDVTQDASDDREDILHNDVKGRVVAAQHDDDGGAAEF